MTTRVFASPMFLGFDHLEQILERASKSSGDGYPPYNIEQTGPAVSRDPDCKVETKPAAKKYLDPRTLLASLRNPLHSRVLIGIFLTTFAFAQFGAAWAESATTAAAVTATTAEAGLFESTAATEGFFKAAISRKRTFELISF